MEHTTTRKPLADWLSTAEVAELCGVEQVTVRQAINRKRLTSTMKGGVHLIRREDALALWREVQQGPMQ
jgi:excisionase family DNA binding protein